MSAYILKADDLLRVKPGTIVACKCDSHFEIHAVLPASGEIDATDWGKDGKSCNFHRQMWKPYYMCLPMRLVSVPKTRCMFEEIV